MGRMCCLRFGRCLTRSGASQIKCGLGLGVESDFVVTFVCLTLQRCAGNGQIGDTYADSCHIHPIQSIVICQNRSVYMCTMGRRLGSANNTEEVEVVSDCNWLIR